ncbi:hypothetical protein AAC387_Pa07g1005 [Persea americana]
MKNPLDDALWLDFVLNLHLRAMSYSLQSTELILNVALACSHLVSQGTKHQIISGLHNLNKENVASVVTAADQVLVTFTFGNVEASL